LADRVSICLWVAKNRMNLVPSRDGPYEILVEKKKE